MAFVRTLVCSKRDLARVKRETRGWQATGERNKEWHMSNDDFSALSRRQALAKGARALAAIGIVVAGVRPVFGKPKAAKDDFYFQDTPNDDGKNCTGCINFTPKSAGLYGKDSGDCALLEGDVCTHCYCQGWTDKNSAGAKKAGT